MSDTARWVAAYRALETQRADALFHDSLADRLAGERGHAMVETEPRIMRGGWPIVTRTKLIDDVIATAMAEGCDRVLNLAAGLDTRPYRLDLPADFVWIEADLPPLTAEKEAMLAEETPRCTLLRYGVDLAEPAERDRFLDTALGPLGPDNTSATKALVLTEGLLMYLDEQTVSDLARALTRPQITWWVMDLVMKMKPMRNSSNFENAPMRFEPANGIAYFEDLGWNPLEVEHLLAHARKLGRAPWFLRPFIYLPPPNGRTPWSGVIGFQRT